MLSVSVIFVKVCAIGAQPSVPARVKSIVGAGMTVILAGEVIEFAQPCWLVTVN